jgi:altronate dehydratase
MMQIKTPRIQINEVKDWVDTFDGNDATVILAAIANNELNTEEMIDSILAFADGETSQAEFWYQQMWRKEE